MENKNDNIPNQRPFCRCLYEIENSLPRTQRCFVPCDDQWQIIRERDKIKEQEKGNTEK